MWVVIYELMNHIWVPIWEFLHIYECTHMSCRHFIAHIWFLHESYTCNRVGIWHTYMILPILIYSYMILKWIIYMSVFEVHMTYMIKLDHHMYVFYNDSISYACIWFMIHCWYLMIIYEYSRMTVIWSIFPMRCPGVLVPYEHHELEELVRQLRAFFYRHQSVPRPDPWLSHCWVDSVSGQIRF